MIFFLVSNCFSYTIANILGPSPGPGRYIVHCSLVSKYFEQDDLQPSNLHSFTTYSKYSSQVMHVNAVLITWDFDSDGKSLFFYLMETKATPNPSQCFLVWGGCCTVVPSRYCRFKLTTFLQETVKLFVLYQDFLLFSEKSKTKVWESGDKMK